MASSFWYSTLYGTAMKRPSAPRRMVVKKPVARAFSAPLSESSHFSTSALVAPSG
jgi:hypothetical protein